MTIDHPQATARRWDRTRYYIVEADGAALEHETLGVLLFGSKAEAERYIRAPWSYGRDTEGGD